MKTSEQVSSAEEDKHTTTNWSEQKVDSPTSNTNIYNFNQQNILKIEHPQELEMLSKLPEDLRAAVIAMARDEQSFKHKIATNDQEALLRMQSESLHAEINAEISEGKRRDRSELIGKIMSFLLLSGMGYIIHLSGNSKIFEYFFGFGGGAFLLVSIVRTFILSHQNPKDPPKKEEEEDK